MYMVRLLDTGGGRVKVNLVCLDVLHMTLFVIKLPTGARHVKATNTPWHCSTTTTAASS